MAFSLSVRLYSELGQVLLLVMMDVRQLGAHLFKSLVSCRVSGDKQSSLVGAIINTVMPATVTRISNITKRFWQKDESSENNRPLEVSPQSFSNGKADPLRSHLSVGIIIWSLYTIS